MIITSAQHEICRDEARALSIAIEPTSFLQLPFVLKNEGHPFLWYTILRMAFLITHTPVILKITSICICFAGVALFFRFAPFPTWLKILFIFGLPLYEYSVVARNYGISMLLFFLFAVFYKKRQEKPLLMAGILFLLSNTNAHSCILSGVLMIMWAIDDLLAQSRPPSFHAISSRFGAYLLVLAGILFAVITTLPTQDSIVTKAFSMRQLMNAVLINIRHPADSLTYVTLGTPNLIADSLLWMLVAGLLIRGPYAAAMCSGMILLGIFFTIIYPGMLHHQGLFLVFVITVYWICRNEMPQNIEGKYSHLAYKLHAVSLFIIIPILLLVQVIMSINKTTNDITKEVSASYSFSKYLVLHPEYHDAIIIGEPDYLIESLPYYISNPIFIPREKKFRKYTKFTEANKQNMSMGELLNIAKTVKREQGKPVLLVFGHLDIANKTKTMDSFHFKKSFTWSLKELSEFNESTTRLAVFKYPMTDENYELYALRQQ